MSVAATLPGRPVRNGLAWKPYRYQGTGPDVLTPFLDDPEPVRATAPRTCYCAGTMYAYRQHLAKGEDPCQASRDDVNLNARNRNRAKVKAHLRASDGKPRCGGRGTLMAATRDGVTCGTCLSVMAVTGGRAA